MADMDVDVPAESAPAPIRSKAKEDGKKRFEVKKVRAPLVISGSYVYMCLLSLRKWNAVALWAWGV